MKTLRILVKWITDGASTFVKWMSAHPIQTFVSAMSTGAIATCWAFMPDWSPGLIPISIFGLALLYLSIHWFEKKLLLVLLLTVSIVTPSNTQEPIAYADGSGGSITDPECGAGAVVGVVVIVAAGYVVYKLIKFCQRHFPKDTTKKKDDDGSGGLAVDTDAASFNFDELGSCLPCDRVGSSLTGDGGAYGGYASNPVTFQLDLAVRVDEEDDVHFTPTLTTITGKTNIVDFGDFAREIQEDYGVKVTGHQGTEFHSRNGVPIPKEESSIHYDYTNGKIKIGTGDYSVIVERSFDFQEWTQILHTEVSAGMTVRVIDTTPTGKAYYRYRGLRTD